jgi:hypothetical protein
MPKSAAVLSSQLQSRWQRWGAYWFLLLASVFLLVAEQSSAARTLWDVAQISARPGLVTVGRIQETRTQVQNWISWRRSVLQRLAQSESELAAQDLRTADLTRHIESLEAQALHASSAGILEASFWQPSTWEGIPGSWQVRAGCLQGIQVGDPVVTPQGVLVGSITAVQKTYSQATSWDAPGLSVPARVGTSSAVALVQSTLSEPQISGLRWPTVVQVGESVVTAGSGNTPRNLLIGNVASLQPRESFGEVTGSIRQSVSLNRVQDVLVPRGEGATCLAN